MANPRILYLNRTIGATITASAEDSGYPDDNLGDWREYEKWQGSAANSYTIIINLGSAASVTAFALVGHNLNTCGARYKLEAGTDDITFGTAVVAYTTPATDRSLADYFTNPGKQYLQLTIDNNGGAVFTPSIGVLFLGDYLTMERLPETPLDPDEIEDVKEELINETGSLIGAIIDHTLRRQSWSFKWLTQAWVTATWLPFLRTYRNLPFIFHWDVDTDTAAVYLVRFSNNTHTAPYVDSYRTLSFSLIGRFEP